MRLLVSALSFFVVCVSFSTQKSDDVSYYDEQEPILFGRDRLNYPVTSYEFTISSQSHYLPSQVGNLIAGRAEFPWLVDIRPLGDEDQNSWAPGNLLTTRHILTTCRFVKFLEAYDDMVGPLASNLYPTDVKVIFASSYLWEDHDAPIQIKSWPRPNEIPTIFTTGSRMVRLMMPHPSCDDNPVEFDVGLLELVEFIFPVPPFINFMPVGFARSKMKMTNYNAQLVNLEKINCYVASFGRNWLNAKNHWALDFKVKYRVYFEKWDLCGLAFQKGYYNCSPAERSGAYQMATPCVGNIIQPSVSADRINDGWAAAKCFNTRAPVGSVCDHDSGAPVVCNGDVVGIVIRGASHDFCSNVYPVPFVVLKIVAAADYFINLVKAPFRFAPLQGDRPYSQENWAIDRSFAHPQHKSHSVALMLATFLRVIVF